MKINSEIIEILAEYNVHKDNAICYLISLYFGYKPSYIPDDFKKKMNTTRIYEIDRHNSLQWNIPLFQGDDKKTDPFDWVKSEYQVLFKNTNLSRAGNGNECVRRMKAFFAENPDVRKEEVLGAVELYLSKTDSDYIRTSHYFIVKGRGLDRISDLEEWLKIYREKESKLQSTITNTTGKDVVNKMQ